MGAGPNEQSTLVAVCECLLSLARWVPDETDEYMSLSTSPALKRTLKKFLELILDYRRASSADCKYRQNRNFVGSQPESCLGKSDTGGDVLLCWPLCFSARTGNRIDALQATHWVSAPQAQ
jgi:hypothetical protein